MAGLIRVSTPGERPTGEINESTSVAEVLKRCPTARRIFDQYGLKGCGTEHGPTEPLSFFAAVHQVDLQALLRDLKAEAENPSTQQYVYRESLADYIYRRFFEAGIAITLTVGALWGATNLLQIALDKNLLQLRLVPSIHAHAHAMIFGWVGLFVMGFAYQSFPRFKFTTLWRPDLANLTFVLMLAGIGARIGAELLQPASLGLGLGVLSAGVEFAAISLFVLIILRTARQSMEPRNPYERFIFGAFFWFLVQAIFSDIFFFAKATAASQAQLIHRIALLDAPYAKCSCLVSPPSSSRSQPALCSGGVRSQPTAARRAETDFRADERQPHPGCDELYRSALLRQPLLRRGAGDFLPAHGDLGRATRPPTQGVLHARS